MDPGQYSTSFIVLLHPHEINMDNLKENKLNSDEKKQLEEWTKQLKRVEMAQAQELIDHCNISFQFAKTHSNYVKDWEKTKENMELRLENNDLPPGVSSILFRAMIDSADKVIEKKLEKVRDAFGDKFNESIYNYLGSDGKTKKLFGIFG